MNSTEVETSTGQLLLFSWIEYTVFFFMLGLSSLIGVYYGCVKPQNTVAEYLLGGKKMSIFPVSMSQLASVISGVTLIGIPSETYVYGTQLYAITWCNVVVSLFIYYFYLPVIYPLQYVSLFEYLEKRFSETVRKIASMMYGLLVLTYIPVVIYVPALTFNQVTGMSIHTITPIICTICIFYTTLGGLKAVVWSDALQSIFIIFSIIAVLIIGCHSVGGMETVFNVSGEGERLEFFNMNPDPMARSTFWSVLIGSSFSWFSLFALNPSAMQRYTSLPSMRDARIVTIIFCFGIVLVKTLVTFNGLIIYTKYHDCDPVMTKTITKPGQLLPYYIMDVARDFPGLSGLFISGVVSAALSTMSTGLNTMSGTVYEDFLKPCLPKKLSERTTNIIMKLTVVILGVLCMLMVFAVEKLGGISQMALSLAGITAGPIFFVFSFGMFFPWATTKGAIAGSVTSVILMCYIVGGAQLSIARGQLRFPGKVTTIEGCPVNMTFPEGLNGTRFGHPGVGSPVEYDEDVWFIYRISYLHYSTLGALVATLVGVLVTLATGTQDLEQLDPKLIIPQMRRFLPRPKSKTKEEEADSLMEAKVEK